MIKNITISQEMVHLRETFVTALRQVSSYPVVRVSIQLDSGEIGLGECVATPQITGDSFEKIWQELNSREVQNLTEISPEIIDGLDLLNSSKAALDMACWNLRPYQSRSVRTDITIPIAKISNLAKLITARKAAGFNAFKLKVEQDSIPNLLRRVEIIRELAGEQSLIRIDPNQAWHLDYAIRAAQELARTGASIEYLEQPLHRFDFAGHKALAEESSIPLMADESCSTSKDLAKTVESRAFEFLNIKILKAGGVVPALKLAHEAQASGLKVSIGSMMEGDLGIRSAIYLAHLIAPDAIHDLDAAWWIRDSKVNYQASKVKS
jgi:L-alanine-DL-glutamate epimerase-like enolase superfamily enzyme